MKILIVEDEIEMLQNMRQSLEMEKYIVEVAPDYFTATSKIGTYRYDCIILDISLPGGSGLTLLEELKAQRKTDGVIIVSAKDSLEDKLMGLNLGADDYLSKPFDMAELNARIKAVFRRRNMEGNTVIKIANLAINIENRQVYINNKEVKLNRKEFGILFYLSTNKDRLVRKTTLAEHVWGDHIDQTDSFEFLYSQIKNLRKKLSNYHADIQIEAVYGIGYKLSSL